MNKDVKRMFNQFDNILKQTRIKKKTRTFEQKGLLTLEMIPTIPLDREVKASLIGMFEGFISCWDIPIKTKFVQFKQSGAVEFQIRLRGKYE